MGWQEDAKKREEDRIRRANDFAQRQKEDQKQRQAAAKAKQEKLAKARRTKEERERLDKEIEEIRSRFSGSGSGTATSQTSESPDEICTNSSSLAQAALGMAPSRSTTNSRLSNSSPVLDRGAPRSSSSNTPPAGNQQSVPKLWRPF